jgi:methionyl-tRNA formyltransferase
MKIVLCCATRRGVLFLERLRALAPEAELVVFSFREEPHEPPFLDDLRRLCEGGRCQLHEAKALGSDRLAAFWAETPFDLMLAVSWRYMIPRFIYERARIGAYVFHDSLLPAYRGFSPSVWAIINGEDHTGVTLFEMAEGVDEGDIVDQDCVPIRPDETIAEVLERVTSRYLSLLERNIGDLLAGRVAARPQDARCATYCCKRVPADNEIDWSRPTAEIYNLVRAVTRPYPGAYTFLGGKRVVVWAVRRPDVESRYVGRVPGRLVQITPGGEAVVLTGDGSLIVSRAETEDGAELAGASCLRPVGQTFGGTTHD